MDQDQTAPIGAVCSGSTPFASILNSSVFAADDFSRRYFHMHLWSIPVIIKNRVTITPIQMVFRWRVACGPTLKHDWDCIYQAVICFRMKLYLMQLYLLLSLWIVFVLANDTMMKYHIVLHCISVFIVCHTVAEPEGVQGVRLNPSSQPLF